MEQLILRQAVIDEGMSYINGDCFCDKEDFAKYVEFIKQLPPIQPESHTGHWEPVGMAEAVGGESAMWGSAIAYHVCSECREQALEEDGEEKLSDFCPHCGAKMEGTT